jgi:hypothetical protein
MSSSAADRSNGFNRSSSRVKSRVSPWCSHSGGGRSAANCMGCHDTGIYTRKNHLVRSLDALKQRLGDCSHMAKKEFSAVETQNIIKYLNDEFYRFP